MILTGPEIHKRVRDGRIEITPFNENQINPASYDLRLGNTLVTYYKEKGVQGMFRTLLENLTWDTKQENPHDSKTFDQITLQPGILYLMHTEEIVCAHDTVPIVDGKSSIGRLGISVHQTAGFGDIEFRGQYTLEVTVVHPVIVYAGMRFCQIRFHEVVGEIQRYQGNYQGETAMGPVASRSWRQFK